MKIMFVIWVLFGSNVNSLVNVTMSEPEKKYNSLESCLADAKALQQASADSYMNSYQVLNGKFYFICRPTNS